MEHESFEDEEVAELLNRDFICIKVDREERPDIDAVYMAVCQTVTGAGGWPMTIIMTPEQKPFFAATYLPKLSRYGINGMMELLPLVVEEWMGNRNYLLETGNKISAFLQEQTNTIISTRLPDKALLNKAVSQFQDQFDKKYGGIGSAPKFPTPHNLIFLLRYSKLSGDNKGKEMAEKTLVQMFRGGIFDQIGGGFSRYSTDAKWLVPHFEKMLYDNALLSFAYWEAFQMTRRLLYERAAVRTLEYVLDELTDPLGGFYCGQDADSDGIEGKYYVFDEREVADVLGDKKGKEFCDWFDITKKGNFEGKSIPNLLSNEQYENANARIQELCALIYDYRLKRNLLHKDDKILTSWNALMIAAFAKAYSVGGNKRYLEAAKKAVKFIQTYLTDS